MFDGEHRFQVIVEAAFDNYGTSLDSTYADDRQNHPAVKMYTLQPRLDFALPQRPSGDRGHDRVLSATVYRVISSVAENSWNSSLISRSGWSAGVRGGGRAPGGARPEELDNILFGEGAHCL